jgi:hypothetical protein
LARYVASLPGEKYLVWGEGLADNRQRLGKFLSSLGVTILEDETVISKKFKELSISGKLPELAKFKISEDPQVGLTATSSSLNSYLWLKDPDFTSLHNYELSGAFHFSKKTGGVGALVYCRYSNVNDVFYRLRWSGHNPRPEIYPHGTGPLLGKISSSQRLSFDTDYNFRIAVFTAPTETTINAKFWPAVLAEPKEWDIQAVDRTTQRISSGTVGVWTNGRGDNFSFDNFKITPLGADHALFSENFLDERLFVQRWEAERHFDKEIAPLLPAKINILLAHSPEIINNYKIKNFDMILSGDTHGGQICWPWGTPVWRKKELPPDWYSGFHDLNGQKMYISKGIGTSRLPIRLFCRPEITVIDF